MREGYVVRGNTEQQARDVRRGDERRHPLRILSPLSKKQESCVEVEGRIGLTGAVRIARGTDATDQLDPHQLCHPLASWNRSAAMLDHAYREEEESCSALIAM